MPTENTIRHKTQKRTLAQVHINNVSNDAQQTSNSVSESEKVNDTSAQSNIAQYNFGESTSFHNILEESARVAYSRPWHRLERGLRLNRIRLYVDDLSQKHQLTKEEKENIFAFLQRALDRKLLNTLKIVVYDTSLQRILSIKGFEIMRMPDGQLKWGFVAKRKTECTRRKKKADEEQ
jgi:hypothetical protein